MQISTNKITNILNVWVADRVAQKNKTQYERGRKLVMNEIARLKNEMDFLPIKLEYEYFNHHDAFAQGVKDALKIIRK